MNQNTNQTSAPISSTIGGEMQKCRTICQQKNPFNRCSISSWRLIPNALIPKKKKLNFGQNINNYARIYGPSWPNPGRT